MTIAKATLVVLLCTLVLRGNSQSPTGPANSVSIPVSSASPFISMILESSTPAVPVSAGPSTQQTGRSPMPDKSPVQVDEDTWIILNAMEDLLRKMNELLSILGLAAPGIDGTTRRRPTNQRPSSASVDATARWLAPWAGFWASWLGVAVHGVFILF